MENNDRIEKFLELAEISYSIAKDDNAANNDERYVAAAQTYAQLAEQKNIVAMKKYAICLENGRGVERDVEKACKLNNEAISLENGIEKLKKQQEAEQDSSSYSDEVLIREYLDEKSETGRFYSDEAPEFNVYSSQPNSSQNSPRSESQFESLKCSKSLPNSPRSSAQFESQPLKYSKSAPNSSRSSAQSKLISEIPLLNLEQLSKSSSPNSPKSVQIEKTPLNSAQNSVRLSLSPVSAELPTSDLPQEQNTTLSKKPVFPTLQINDKTINFDTTADVENCVIDYVNKYLSSLNDYYNVVLSDKETELRAQYKTKINNAWENIEKIIKLENDENFLDKNSNTILTTLETYHKKHGNDKIVWDKTGIIKREIYNEIKDTINGANEKQTKNLQNDFLKSLQIPKKVITKVYSDNSYIGTVNYSRTAKYLADKKEKSESSVLQRGRK